MSASLVGSEMCIRDSYTLGAGRHPRRVLSPPSCVNSLPRPPIRGLGWPVSYTHLTLPTICSV
eukprot:169286-Alexandrium_andersonii.AAC.1